MCIRDSAHFVCHFLYVERLFNEIFKAILVAQRLFVFPSIFVRRKGAFFAVFQNTAEALHRFTRRVQHAFRQRGRGFSAFFAVLPPEAQADNSRSKLRHKESITVIRFFIKSSAFLKMVIFFYLDYKGKCAAASRRKLTEFPPLFCRFFQFKAYAKNLQKHLLFGISYCILNSCRLEFTRSLREFDLYG